MGRCMTRTLTGRLENCASLPMSCFRTSRNSRALALREALFSLLAHHCQRAGRLHRSRCTLTRCGWMWGSSVHGICRSAVVMAWGTFGLLAPGSSGAEPVDSHTRYAVVGFWGVGRWLPRNDAQRELSHNGARM